MIIKDGSINLRTTVQYTSVVATARYSGTTLLMGAKFWEFIFWELAR